MKKFIPAASKHYCEIYQDSDLKFAFAVEDDESVTQVHDFIKCRDFFNEALVGSQLKCESPSIYGFKYPSEKTPADTETTRLILKGADFTKFLKNLDILMMYEKGLSDTPTRVEKIPETDFYYLTGPSRWMLSTVMISFYTHILRCLYQFDNTDEKDLIGFLSSVADRKANSTSNAVVYQNSINKINFDLLIAKAHEVFPAGTLPFKGMSCITSVGVIHNNSGIVSWSNAIASKKEHMSGMYGDSVLKFRSMVG